MKVILAHLLAAAQLAEMAYNADPVDHKREAWEKAKDEHRLAAEAEQLADLASVEAEPSTDRGAINQLGRPVKDLDTLLKDSAPYKELEKHADTLAGTVNELQSMYETLDAENLQVKQERLQLIEENARLKDANTLLNSQLIEKSQKIDELEKSPLSGKSTADAPAETSTPEGAPATTEQPLTAYQKGLLTKAANQAKAAEEAKKNS